MVGSKAVVLNFKKQAFSCQAKLTKAEQDCNTKFQIKMSITNEPSTQVKKNQVMVVEKAQAPKTPHNTKTPKRPNLPKRPGAKFPGIYVSTYNSISIQWVLQIRKLCYLTQNLEHGK